MIIKKYMKLSKSGKSQSAAQAGNSRGSVPKYVTESVARISGAM